MVTKRLYGKEREWSIGQIKTCRKKQHVKIDDMKEMSDLFCSKAAVGGNYNLTRDNRAENPQCKYDIRHYRLDGDLVQRETCCDYLLVNDSRRKAYLIELKGGNIDEAVDQLEAGERICRSELKDYTFYYRIVCSKARTHKIQSVKMRRFREKHNSYLQIKEKSLPEVLD